MKASVILLPLLGLTWLFGLFAVNENTVVFAWLFTIFNSLQVCNYDACINIDMMRDVLYIALGSPAFGNGLLSC